MYDSDNGNRVTKNLFVQNNTINNKFNSSPSIFISDNDKICATIMNNETQSTTNDSPQQERTNIWIVLFFFCVCVVHCVWTSGLVRGLASYRKQIKELTPDQGKYKK